MEFNINCNGIKKCYISNESLEHAEFIDDLAILVVKVLTDDEEMYECPTVLRRFKNSDEGCSYSFIYRCPALFLKMGTKNITRIGKHFIIETEKVNFSGTATYKVFQQVDYEKEGCSIKFSERSIIPGVPQFSLNEDSLIIRHENSNPCLFSLELSDIISIEFSEIEGIDEKHFLVTDIISIKEDEAVTDQLILTIDSKGRRVSKIYSRIKGFLDEINDDLPYLYVREMRQEELRQEWKLAQEYKQKLRRR